MKAYYALIGTWQSFGGHGKGVHLYRVDVQTGDWTFLDQFEDVVDPGIVCVTSDGRFAYSVIETKSYCGEWGNGGGVMAYRLNLNQGCIEPLNQRSSLGACPAYITVDHTGSYVLLCNHGSHLEQILTVVQREDGSYAVVNQTDDSSVVLFPILPDGSLGKAHDVHISSQQPDNLSHPHLHSVNVSLDNRYVYALDKGQDLIYVYRLLLEQGRLEPASTPMISAVPGSAPRHMAFHPNGRYAYVANEKGGSVSAYAICADGALERIDFVPLIEDETVCKDTSCSDIHVSEDGEYVFVSTRAQRLDQQRGLNAIAVLKALPNGTLRLTDIVATQPTPRGFALSPDGRFVFVANQFRDCITRYLFCPQSGRLLFDKLVAFPATPTCISILCPPKEGMLHDS